MRQKLHTAQEAVSSFSIMSRKIMTKRSMLDIMRRNQLMRRTQGPKKNHDEVRDPTSRPLLPLKKPPHHPLQGWKKSMK
ncbi:hypothetical protein EYF80_052527 [Liparis tanakae]|uniref:Uncharacterized protein n=1 Tax=Liparis tanakae TaxID=230148 RepID=A0A4Z2F821_9TELE|nr:hypothetical protein EYF80_052527 [Liparis tanakae]